LASASRQQAGAATRRYDDLNVSSDAFWEQKVEDRDLIFKQLRQQRPIETALHPDPNDSGFWAVVRHADIVEVSKNTEVFVSRYGVMFDVLPPVFLQMAMSFLAMDNPQHDKVRGLVGKAFTRPQIKRIEDDIASRARRSVSNAAATRSSATPGWRSSPTKPPPPRRLGPMRSRHPRRYL
jgi:cytochrome P450